MKFTFTKNVRARRLAFIVLAVLVALSGWAAFAFHVIAGSGNSAGQVREVRENGWEFISPLLECSTAESLGGHQVRTLEQSVRLMVQQKLTGGEATQVSLYFRDLNNGPWFGVDENERFAPGSMLKVPLMMAYYRLAEKDPSILRREIEFVPFNIPGGSVSQDVESAGQLVSGRKYTVQSLIENMIIYSDNNSTAMLWNAIDQESKDRTYSDLGIPVPVITDWMANVITVRDYTAFLRVLFNASYLNREYSNRALQLMTRTSYTDGLVAGLPIGTRVAHKFGIRFKEGTAVVQLHDCGIVYAPEKPYILCVMTKGHSLRQQGKVIADIARIVNDAVVHGIR